MRFTAVKELLNIRRLRSGDSSRPGTGNVEVRLLQVCASRSVTDDDCTRPERRRSPHFRVGHTASLLQLHWLPVRCYW